MAVGAASGGGGAACNKCLTKVVATASFISAASEMI